MQTLQKLGVVTWRMRQSSFVGRNVVALCSEKLKARQVMCGGYQMGALTLGTCCSALASR